MKLFEFTKIPMLNQALDAYSLRHKAIASNIANIATPGYKAKAVELEDELRENVRRVMNHFQFFGQQEALGDDTDE